MTGRLAHEDDFLDQYVEDHRPSGEPETRVPAPVSEMTRRGAPSTCHVVCEDPQLDGQVLGLTDAVDALLGGALRC